MRIHVLLLFIVTACIGRHGVRAEGRKILVLGGNGFIGGETVTRFIQDKDEVTIVNRKNWYWDSDKRIKPYVTTITCDRKEGIASCDELMDIIKRTRFDTVVDFSAQNADDIYKTTNVLKNHALLYVLASTSKIYDVCTRDDHDVRSSPVKESEDKRPDSEEEVEKYKKFYPEADKKLAIEEALRNQRMDGPGIPYIIFRIPDTIGPRDTTYRWWTYQLLLRTNSVNDERKDFPIPARMKDYPMSLAFVDDVADVIFKASQMRTDPKVIDQAYNLGFSENITLPQMLHDMQQALGVEQYEFAESDETPNLFYMYPSNRRGPLDTTKVREALDWNPTPWRNAVRKTVEYYEHIMREGTLPVQRDEIIQISSHRIAGADENKTKRYYHDLERVYSITLDQFTGEKGEL